MKSLIPLRPENFVSPLQQPEQTALTWYVLSGCTKKEAFISFARPDMLGSSAKAAVEDYVRQFYARKEVKEYLDAYRNTLDEFLHPKPKPTEKTASMEERKAKAKAKAMEFAMDLAEHIDEAQDPEFVMKMLDKTGILEGEDEIEVQPQRFLAERCSDCRYRVFCEQECDDLCQYCRYKTYGEENGIHYESKDQLDMPNKIGTVIESTTE